PATRLTRAEWRAVPPITPVRRRRRSPLLDLGQKASGRHPVRPDVPTRPAVSSPIPEQQSRNAIQPIPGFPVGSAIETRFRRQDSGGSGRAYRDLANCAEARCAGIKDDDALRRGAHPRLTKLRTRVSLQVRPRAVLAERG